jgi:hypothetical protein
VNLFLAADLVIGAHTAVQQAIEFGWFFGPGLALAAVGWAADYTFDRWRDRKKRRTAARVAEAEARMPRTQPADNGQARIDTRPGIDRPSLDTCNAIWNTPTTTRNTERGTTT